MADAGRRPRPLANSYGPTEATIIATAYEPPPTAAAGRRRRVPIGRPIANTRVYVLDRAAQPAPIGVPGELYIGGVGLGARLPGPARADRPALRPRPVRARRAGRRALYRTGDRARWRAGRRAGVPGPRRPPGQAARLPHRAGRDRGGAARAPGGPRRRRGPAQEESAGDRRLWPPTCATPRLQTRRPQTALRAEQVAAWRGIYETPTSRHAADRRSAFNITGWNSSYTGAPIPAGRCASGATARSSGIRALRPQRVWEIGCGSGLLLLPLAPRCAEYLGTDFSARGARRAASARRSAGARARPPGAARGGRRRRRPGRAPSTR